MNPAMNLIMNRARFPRRIATALLAVFAAITTAGPALGQGQGQPAPGMYEVTTTTVYTDVPDMPDTTVTTQTCLTREDLDSDPASVFAGLPEGRSCQVGDFVMEGGNIELKVDCSTPEGDMVMLTLGTYDGQGYDMVTDVTITVGDQSVKMQSTIAGRLLGDC
jgi:hypothetical protein